MNFDGEMLKWIREPDDYSVSPEKIEIVTKPHMLLVQRAFI